MPTEEEIVFERHRVGLSGTGKRSGSTAVLIQVDSVVAATGGALGRARRQPTRNPPYLTISHVDIRDHLIPIEIAHI